MGILGEKSWVVRRYNGDGAIVNHRRTDGTFSTFSILASVQPMRGEEIQLSGIENASGRGQRSRRFLKGYTRTLLRTVDELNESLADELTYSDGEQYVIHRTWEYEDGVLDHYKFIAVRGER